MRSVLCIIAILAALAGSAQDSVSIQWNGTTLLHGAAGEGAAPTVTIQRASLQSKKTFTMGYKEEAPQRGWERTFFLADTTGEDIRTVKGKSFTMKASTFRSLLRTHKKLLLYTWSLPTDPAMQAAVRVRRVHVATVVLE